MSTSVNHDATWPWSRRATGMPERFALRLAGLYVGRPRDQIWVRLGGLPYPRLFSRIRDRLEDRLWSRFVARLEDRLRGGAP